MYIDSGAQPAPLKCPCCGRELYPEDYTYCNEQLKVVGCEFCLIKQISSQMTELLEETA